jgi:hypothetical protein
MSTALQKMKTEMKTEMEMRGFVSAAALVAALALAACAGETASAKAPEASTAAASGTVVDSVHSMDEELRRFTAGLGPAPTELAGGEATADALARRWLAALAAGDTAALRQMHVSRAEFAWLYWRDSHLSKPPYEMPPGLLWFSVEGESNAGIKRALAAYAGKRLAFESMACGNERVEGRIRIHQGCDVTFRVDGKAETRRLFGNLLERGAQVKFLSYASDF